MDDQSRISVESAQRLIESSPFGRWWGYRVEKLGPGSAQLLLPVQPGFERPGGVLQGGCAMTLADVTFWIAGMTVTGEEPMCVTLQMSSSFLRPARLGDLRCEARVVKPGRRVLYGEASCLNEAGEVISRHSLTYLRPEPRGSPG
jgi:uncharacterized protein (TIGR00369 family)